MAVYIINSTIADAVVAACSIFWLLLLCVPQYAAADARVEKPPQVVRHFACILAQGQLGRPAQGDMGAAKPVGSTPAADELELSNLVVGKMTYYNALRERQAVPTPSSWTHLVIEPLMRRLVPPAGPSGCVPP